jgi:hypothetical protein
VKEEEDEEGVKGLRGFWSAFPKVKKGILENIFDLPVNQDLQ